MVASKTHNEIVLRPPPGTRFTIWGSDVRIEFQRGREREIVTWLYDWIERYIEPEARKVESSMRSADTQPPDVLSSLQSLENVEIVEHEIPAKAEVSKPPTNVRKSMRDLMAELKQAADKTLGPRVDKQLIPRIAVDQDELNNGKHEVTEIEDDKNHG